MTIRNAIEFGKAIRAARKEMGLNQSELAARCGVGVNFITDLERGKGTSQVDKAITVAVELGFVLPNRPARTAQANDTTQEDQSPSEASYGDGPDDDLAHVPRF